MEVDDIDKVGNIAKSIDDVFANSQKRLVQRPKRLSNLDFVK